MTHFHFILSNLKHMCIVEIFCQNPPSYNMGAIATATYILIIVNGLELPLTHWPWIGMFQDLWHLNVSCFIQKGFSVKTLLFDCIICCCCNAWMDDPKQKFRYIHVKNKSKVYTRGMISTNFWWYSPQYFGKYIVLLRS